MNQITPNIGLPLFGEPLDDGRAVILSAEDSQEDIHRRIESIAGTERPKRLHVIPLPSVGGAHPLYSRLDDGRITQTYWWSDIIKQLKEYDDLKLIVIDPLSPLIPGGQNDNDFAQAVMSDLVQVATLLCCVILIAHHMSKGNQEISGKDKVRGASGWTDGSRWTYVITECTDTNIKKKCIKQQLIKPNQEVFTGGIAKVNNGGSIVKPDTNRILVHGTTGVLRDITDLVNDNIEPDFEQALIDTIIHGITQGVPFTIEGRLNGLKSANRLEHMHPIILSSGNQRVLAAKKLLLENRLVKVGNSNQGWLDVPNGSLASSPNSYQHKDISECKKYPV